MCKYSSTVISHNLLNPELVIFDGSPRSHPTTQGDPLARIPIDMGVPTGALDGPGFSFDINHFKNPFKKFLLFLVLLLLY